MATICSILIGLALGVVVEGFLKPVQVEIFRYLWHKLDQRAKIIEAEAEKTISELDDFFLAYCRQNIDKLTEIIDRPSVSPEEVTEIIAQVLSQYDLGVLLEKV